jgi:hypothetical protein
MKIFLAVFESLHADRWISTKTHRQTDREKLTIGRALQLHFGALQGRYH